jgi:plastocyanin
MDPTWRDPRPAPGPGADLRRATVPDPMAAVGQDGTRTKRVGSAAAAVTLGMGLLMGCGDDGEPEVDAGGPPVVLEGGTVQIDSLDNIFRPEDAQITAGTEVVWRNRGRNVHNVLPVDGDGWGVEVDDFGPGETYAHTFTEAGTYPYYCSLHGTTTAGMIGTITVVEP